MTQERTAIVAVPLTIVVRGEVVTSNFGEFKKHVESGLAKINYAPATDIEFGEAQELVKGLAAIEVVIQNTLDEALAASAEMNRLFTEAGALKKTVAASRLNLSKQIDSRKEQKRADALRNCLEGLETKTPLVFRSDAEAVIKGKKSLDAIIAALTDFQVRVNGRLRAAKGLLANFEEKHGGDLLSDRSRLEVMELALLEHELESRLEKKVLRDKAAAEAQARKLAEAQAKATQSPAPPPTPPATQPPPVATKPVVASQADEWLQFRTSVQSAAMLIRTGRDELKIPENQERAAAMVKTLNVAWLAVQKPENRKILLEQIDAIEAWLKNNK